MSGPAVGTVLRMVSGTRPISVTVVAVADDGAVTLRCGPNWSFQCGMEFTLTADKLAASKWAAL